MHSVFNIDELFSLLIEYETVTLQLKRVPSNTKDLFDSKVGI